MQRLIKTTFVITIICAGTFADIENSGNLKELKWDPHLKLTKMVMNEGKSFLTILDAFYFTIVTLITVGYGEITPLTVTGKLICMGIIMITLVYIPTETVRFLDLMSSQSKYATSSYTSQDNEHVLVTG